ncbi:MAG: type II toxin-antitoxin system HicB family antitoxin [Bacteroidetes bacterium]|nr:type II toxin-antitoxin system HicB family antitoxin [Bacteroidota bacterium]
MRPQEITVTICVERDGDGFYAYAPALKGLHVGGDTEEEVLKNIEDGIILYLDSLFNCGEPFPEGPDLKIREYNDTLTKEISVLWPYQKTLSNKSKMSRPRELYAH